MPFLSTFYPQFVCITVYNFWAHLTYVDKSEVIHKLLDTYPHKPIAFWIYKTHWYQALTNTILTYPLIHREQQEETKKRL